MTNGDVIRSMTDEELAAFLTTECFRLLTPVLKYARVFPTQQLIFANRLLWLRQPAEVNDG